MRVVPEQEKIFKSLSGWRRQEQERVEADQFAWSSQVTSSLLAKRAAAATVWPTPRPAGPLSPDWVALHDRQRPHRRLGRGAARGGIHTKWWLLP